MTKREQTAFGAAIGVIAAFLANDLDLLSLLSYWGDRLILLPVGLAVGAACAATRLRKPFYVACGALAFLWLGVAYGPISRLLLPGLVRSDALHQADAVLVLATRMQTDGDPTSAQLARLYRGLELVKDGLAPRLIISELPPPYAQQRPFVQSMLDRFSPQVELVVLQAVRNTHDEALGAAEYLKAKGLKRIIVTSSPAHTFRSAALLEKLGLDVLATPAKETSFDLENLDRSDERLKAFGVIAHEQLGILVYRRRDWIN